MSPVAPRRPCSQPGCGELVVSGRCGKHQRTVTEIARGTASQRGYGSAWQRYRAWFIQQAECSQCGRNHALCEGQCARDHRPTPAFAVDHIIPHRGDPLLFWKHDNHQSLCRSEHNAKSNSERLTRGGW
jgi:5-methylcytosine-specific restriction enzyme A